MIPIETGAYLSSSSDRRRDDLVSTICHTFSTCNNHRHNSDSADIFSSDHLGFGFGS